MAIFRSVGAFLLLTGLLAHATSFSYQGFYSSDLSVFQLNGAAAGLNPSSDGSLVLTAAQGSSVGSIFSKNSIQVQNFSTSFSFVMKTPGGFGDDDGLGADGLVFVINSQTNSAGSVGSGIGYQGISNSIGIEFDSYNNGYPTDINGNHVGINTNGNPQSVASTAYPTRFNNEQPHYAWVDYDGVTLSARCADTPTRPAAATVSLVIDLATVFGSSHVYVGFTAATGGAWETHQITQWAFTDAYNPITVPPPAAPIVNAVCGNGIVETGEQCDGGSCCTSTCTFVNTAPCFCARQNLADGAMGYYCDGTGGFFQCLGGVFAPQSRDMACAAGTQCGCAVGVECSCHLMQSPCVWAGQSQQC